MFAEMLLFSRPKTSFTHFVAYAKQLELIENMHKKFVIFMSLFFSLQYMLVLLLLLFAQEFAVKHNEKKWNFIPLQFARVHSLLFRYLFLVLVGSVSRG